MRPEQQGIEVAVLVSVGRHPITWRARRADQDARGLEMALGLEHQLPGSRVSLLHAGPRSEEGEAALRGYLGMGLDTLTLLEQAWLIASLDTLDPRIRSKAVQAAKALDEAYANFEKLSGPTAQRVVRFWQVRDPDGDAAA